MKTTSYTARPYILAEANWNTLRETAYQVAVLPWGATEAHNYHLPYATDNYQAEYLVHECCRIAWERGSKVVALPIIPFGVQTGQLDIQLCMNMLPSTQLAILKDVCDVLVRSGISKLVIFNGHGGNDFKAMMRELTFHFPQLFICILNWFKTEPLTGYFEIKGDHADEMETSAMLHIRPELVRPLSEAGDGYAKPYRFKAVQEGWVAAQRQWSEVTKDTGSGNPEKASAEKGKAYLDVVVKKVSDFFVELAETPEGGFYEK